LKADGVVKIDGSSTVYPITEAVAEEFQKSTGTKVTVGISGTGGGFKKFSRGEIDVQEASRPIRPEEAKAAKEAKAEAKKLAAQKEQLAKKEAALEAKQRKENMDRINAQLGATGAADAKGTAQKASGPSASYGGKVRAKVKPNIVFTEDITGNPVAEVEVRTTPGGSITSQRLLKSSGNKAWDEAVLKAIIRTETLPLDTDGRVPTPLIIEFRPKD
jgi:colicin import membrane protein